MGTQWKGNLLGFASKGYGDRMEQGMDTCVHLSSELLYVGGLGNIHTPSHRYYRKYKDMKQGMHMSQLCSKPANTHLPNMQTLALQMQSDMLAYTWRLAVRCKYTQYDTICLCM